MALFNFNRLTGKLMSQLNDNGNGEKTLTGSPINPVEPFRGIRPMPSNPRLGFFGGLGQLAPLIQASDQPSRLGFKGPARPEDKRQMPTEAAFQEGAAAAPAPAPSEQAIMLQPQRPQPAFMNAVAQAGAQPPQGAQGQQGMPDFTDDQLRALAQMVARFMRI
jgi:hypothetical protein